MTLACKWLECLRKFAKRDALRGNACAQQQCPLPVPGESENRSERLAAGSAGSAQDGSRQRSFFTAPRNRRDLHRDGRTPKSAGDLSPNSWNSPTNSTATRTPARSKPSLDSNNRSKARVMLWAPKKFKPKQWSWPRGALPGKHRDQFLRAVHARPAVGLAQAPGQSGPHCTAKRNRWSQNFRPNTSSSRNRFLNWPILCASTENPTKPWRCAGTNWRHCAKPMAPKAPTSSTC